MTLRELADVSGAEIREGADPEANFGDVRSLLEAGPDHVSFLDNKHYIDAFAQTKAGACIVHPDFADKAPPGLALLISTQPYHGYAKIAAAFYPPPPPSEARAATAVIDKTASIGENCRIEAPSWRCSRPDRTSTGLQLFVDLQEPSYDRLHTYGERESHDRTAEY